LEKPVWVAATKSEPISSRED